MPDRIPQSGSLAQTTAQTPVSTAPASPATSPSRSAFATAPGSVASSPVKPSPPSAASRADSAVVLMDEETQTAPPPPPSTSTAPPTTKSTEPAMLDFDKLALGDMPDEQITLAKNQLVNPNEEDRIKLVAMLKQRVITEGLGECIYEVGVDEDGKSMRLNDAEFEAVLKNLAAAAGEINCDATILHERDAPFSEASIAAATAGPSKTTEDTNTNEDSTSVATPAKRASAAKGRFAHVLIRKRSGNMEDVLEIRVAVVGNVDAGKSTMLGVLTKDVLDDGRGKARINLFKHKHEMETGRTSSVGMEIMGFDSHGKPVTPISLGRPKAGWEEVCAESSKVINFIDLAGHEKYLRTTVFGMSGSDPHFVMLMIGSNAGIVGMTKEHLGLALCLNLPVFIVITKVDMCPKPVLESTIKQLTKILKSSGCRKIPMFVKSMDDALLVANNFVSERIAPIFQVSNVTGEGLPILKSFLNILHSNTKGKYDAGKSVEFHITDTFSVPGVGTVVSGTVMSGIVHVGDTLLLGPDSTGAFSPTQVKSIQRKRVNVPTASAGQSASFALKKIKRSAIRKGMVMLGNKGDAKSTMEFEAEVVVLFHSTTIGPKYQAMLHSNCVRQTVKIVEMDREILRTGDRSLMRFRFIQHPEYLSPGARILLREGRTKCVGRVMRCFTEKAGTLEQPVVAAQQQPHQFKSRTPPNHPAGSSKQVRRRPF